MNPWLTVICLLGVLAAMWRSDWLIAKVRSFKSTPARTEADYKSNLELFGPVDVSKTKDLFD